MNLFLLDAGGAGLLYVGILLLILFMVLAVLLEVAVMVLMKYNIRFKKALADSFIVNLASLAAGFVLVSMVSDIFNGYSVRNYILFFAVTFVIESFLLYLLNKDKPVINTLKVSFFMNLLTYLILFLLIGRD